MPRRISVSMCVCVCPRVWGSHPEGSVRGSTDALPLRAGRVGLPRVCVLSLPQGAKFHYDS